MATNMKENGFETMIVKYLVENNHYEEGGNSDYNKIYAIDEVRLFRFLHDTQDEKLAELRIEDNEIEKKKFLDRLSKKISDDGVINIIRKGMKYKNKTVDFYMVRPSEGNQDAKESYDKNIFSVTRQLRYSNDYGRLALDVCIFLNGLPIITMELKLAQRMLRYYVEVQKIAVKEKAGVIVEHFHSEVRQKIKGQARAMVVASSIKRAVEYYMAINKLLEERKSPYKAIIAFSGEISYEGVTYNEAKLNGFPSSKIEKAFRKDPYRLLIVANKFQTGYDEPLLQTMYVDKGLADIKAVQTLSRLNRCHADKNDVFILDFQNDPADIKAAFDKYYKTTILSGETDVNKLNDLVDEMEPLEIYSDDEVAKVAELYIDNADRCEIDPIIDEAVERYKELELDDQIDFKSSAKTFLRTYNFLSSILPYGSIEWEKLSIYLSFLVSKLPKPDTGDADEIIEDVELESYRLVAQDTISIKLEDVDSEIDPVPVKTDVGIPVPEYDTLSNILASFHEKWGNCGWTDEDRVRKQIADLPDIVEQDETYQNAMKYSDAQNARDESDRATYDAILKSLVSGTELYKAFSDDIRNKNNQSFKKWLLDYVFNVTYKPESRE